MLETNLLNSVARFLQRNWDLPDTEESASREDLLLRLQFVMREMLENDFEKLVNTMYRLDVPEAGFHQALAGNSQDEISRNLAEIVLKREFERAKFREMYRRKAEEEQSSPE